MKTGRARMVLFGLVVALTCRGQLATAAEFPLSSKGWQATVVKLEGVNVSKALAVGEVKRENAEEYCERDPGGETIQYGGKLSKEQCV